jgi:hypothetical protein
MSLYVRVLNNFYTHRKTLRLRASIGDAAFWVPPRLWAYAAEHQPDGCFKEYTAPEIAAMIGYSGIAQALLDALLRVGFLDDNPLRIHDWEEHNGYHKSYADRASAAALIRWERERAKKAAAGNGTDLKGKEKKGEKHCAKHAPSSAVLSEPEILTPPVDSNWQARIVAIHGWYSEQMGGGASRLMPQDERLWFEWFKEGFEEDDFKRVFKFKRGRADKGDHPGSLLLRNLLSDRFRESLLLSKQEFKENGKAHQRSNPRLEGVSRNNSVNDYAAAAARKLERQVAQAKHEPSPEAKGT